MEPGQRQALEETSGRIPKREEPLGSKSLEILERQGVTETSAWREREEWSPEEGGPLHGEMEM